MKNIKLKIAFVILAIAGMATLYFLKSTPDYGILPKDFTYDKIQKIEVKRMADNKEITLTEPDQYQSIINQFLKSSLTKVKSARTSRVHYYMRIYFTDNQSELVGLNESNEDGRFIFYKNSKYHNNELFNELDLLPF